MNEKYKTKKEAEKALEEVRKKFNEDNLRYWCPVIKNKCWGTDCAACSKGKVLESTNWQGGTRTACYSISELRCNNPLVTGVITVDS